ncbi:MAG: aminotransferase [Pseudomonadota bacterium]
MVEGQRGGVSRLTRTMRAFNPVFAARSTTIFETMSRLAQAEGAINLGQGFPDEDGPVDIRERAGAALRDGPNQYPLMAGLPELRQAVADHEKRFYGLDIDWSRQTLVTSGATEALAAAFLAFLQPGDEVILIEPFYDSYLAMIEAAGARAVYVSMQPPGPAAGWTLPRERLAQAFGPKTKLIAINTPHNPTGAVLSDDDLAFLAGLVEENDAYVICDEVYEHIVFDGATHRPLMTLPGMDERCVRIGSAGKTFSLTGWKVGYVVGAPDVIAVVAKAHQFLTFTTPPALQAAVAYGLHKSDGYFQGLAYDMQERRDILTAGLKEAGFAVAASAGTYFLTVDISAIGYVGTDAEFCEEITRNAKVAAVPVSAFYSVSAAEAPTNYVRFCFCKSAETLRVAAERLKAYTA